MERHRWYAKFETGFREIYVLHARWTTGHMGSVGLADVHAKEYLGMCAAFLLVYASILWVRRISITITDKRNRPVLDLWRAIEVEATSGKVCIPEKIRDSKLYRIVINKDYPVAFRQRMEKIVENDEKMSKRWEMKMPYWTAFDLPTADEEE